MSEEKVSENNLKDAISCRGIEMTLLRTPLSIMRIAIENRRWNIEDENEFMLAGLDSLAMKLMICEPFWRT